MLTALLAFQSIPAALAGAAMAAAGCLVRLLMNRPEPDTLPVEVIAQASDDSSRVLLCLDGALRGRYFRLTGKLVVGRSPTRCNVVFPEDTRGVSAVHCTLRFTGTAVTVTDENSSYGTYIDGTRLIPGHARIIHRGQIIELGSDQQTLMLR